METTLSFDLAQVTREVDLPLAKVQATVELLDDGNTVPFITRFRRDQTGGLDEEQVRRVQEVVAKLRALTDRKQKILKSLQSQGKLTDDLAERILSTDSVARLEDIYLPYKPKKQTLAGIARSRGLEPLAREILAAEATVADLDARAAQFVGPEHELASVADVLQGVRHLIAEDFSENLPLRDELRKIVASTGKLVSTRIEEAAQIDTDADDEDDGDDEVEDAAPGESASEAVEATAEATSLDEGPVAAEVLVSEPAAACSEGVTLPAADELPLTSSATAADQCPAIEPSQSPDELATPAGSAEPAPAALAEPEAAAVEPEAALAEPEAVAVEPDAAAVEPEAALAEPDAVAVEPDAAAVEPEAALAEPEAAAVEPEAALAEPEAAAAEPEAAAVAAEAEATSSPAATPERLVESPAVGSPELPVAVESRRKPLPLRPAKPPKLTVRQLAAQSRKDAKKRKREKKIESFKDYFRYQEPLVKIPPHRLLAINRGERSKILRIKIEADQEALIRKAEELLIPAGHPHAEFLRTCVRDALARLIAPSLEREVHRELTEYAEFHAVRVFARNLRKLLLQPPVRQRRVLAIDPGFRSGCKLAALDEFGDVLGHTVIHVIGKEEIVRKGRQQVVEMVQMYHLPIIAIGNGAACREAELLVADILANELKEQDVQYVVVNEAGASVYSTSSLGREELPRFDPVLRSAISIGRRLQDPLSELVKITPANIGVGLYQHDVKVKHLEDSLDGVVESCVNYVGVDVNTASPSLLRYVSGLNQLTARRLYEYRQQHGPFRNREQFRLVPGFGEATYVQAAGFLKIRDGDNPLDATWIHPESYELARRLIDKLGGSVSELAASVAREKPAPGHKPRTLAEFAVGLLPKHQSTTATPETAADSQPAIDSQSVIEAQPTVEAVSAEPVPMIEMPVPSAAEAITAGPPAVETEVTASDVSEPAVAIADWASPSSEPVTVSNSPSGAQPASPSLAERASQASIADLVRELGVGEMLLSDLLKSLTRPGRDPREDLPPPAFRREVMRLEDLHPGMELTGTVLNVVDFGAFVDIGLPDSGLIHISRLADRFIRDPHEVVSVGDLFTVWVVEVDKSRRRVSLTAIRPGSEMPREQRKPKAPASGRSEARPAPQQGTRPPQGGRPQQGGRPSQGGRPQQGGRSSGGGPGGAGQQGRRSYGGQPKYQPKPAPPKPVRPISKPMLEGKEPMRSFSDLIQFYQKKDGDEDAKPS